MNKNYFQTFPYHLVEPSPWPLLTSFALLSTTISAVMYFHGYENGGLLLSLGLILTLCGMILWFRDVITEGTYLGNHTKQVQRGLNLGFALFIVSEVMAFFSIFWGFFHASLSPDVFVGSNWPPFGIDALDPFAIPLLNTLLLLSSGAFVTYSHHALINGNRKGALIGALLTIVLAILFTGLQAYEYMEAGFTFADSVFGTVFFASTGLHGLHVIVGTLFLTVGFVRLYLYHLTSDHHLGFEAAILYWHFVDVVWLFLFVSVYWWGGV
jgi:cytochrome c oxidase subunit 3